MLGLRVRHYIMIIILLELHRTERPISNRRSHDLVAIKITVKLTMIFNNYGESYDSVYSEYQSRKILLMFYNVFCMLTCRIKCKRYIFAAVGAFTHRL